MRMRVERVLWILAFAGVGLYSLSIGETWLYQTYLNWTFAQRLRAPDPIPITGISASHGMHSIVPAEGDAIGRIQIPAIELTAIIAEGVEDSTLRRSVGHVPRTGLPGGTRNVVLSAHRDTFFRRLGELKPGDVVSVVTLEGSFDYVVESTGIVAPDERVVMRDIGRPTLTLLTCYPFYYVGSAPRRFVVHAALLGI